MKNKVFFLAVAAVVFILSASSVSAQTLTVEDFVKKAVKNDTAFEEILMDQLYLQYNKALNLPVSDWLMSLKGQYDFIKDTDSAEPEGSVSLDKLFGATGTTLNVSYQGSLNSDYATHSSRLDVSLSQSIAANAFGKVYRYRDKIIGLENEIAGYQVIEAYEDYMAYVLNAYYNWYEAYRNLELGQASYKENLKLLDNIKERKKSKIALDIDVNKTHLQVLAKKKKLVALQTANEKALKEIKIIIRDKSADELIPSLPDMYKIYKGIAASELKEEIQKSRTFSVLEMLEEKSTLDVKRYASELLPSIDVMAGYRVNGNDFDFEQSESFTYVGVKLDYPFLNSVAKAKHEVALLDEKKAFLSKDNVYYRLSKDVWDIVLEMQQAKELLKITQKGRDLAQLVLDDESQNYILGKVTLNDYIAAVNKLDDFQFDYVYYSMQIKKLNIAFLRLTDKLLSKKDI